MPSLYDVAVPIFIRYLGNLDHVLAKGEAAAAEGKVSEAELIGARLYEDMHPLTKQVQFACDSAKFVAQRVGQAEPRPMADDEASLAELRQRVAKTIDYLRSADPAGFDGRDDAQVTLKTPNRDIEFVAKDYVLGFAIPNFFFHVTTSYALLRMKGVAIGKMDYLAGATPPQA